MSDIKKPFKETQIGQWITKNIPTAINAVEGFVPAPVKGAMEFVKHLINNEPSLTPEQKMEGLKLADQHELDLIAAENERIKLDNENTDSARKMAEAMALDKPSWGAKNMIYLIAAFVSLIWGAMTIYLLAHAFRLIGEGEKADLTQILSIYNGISITFGIILNFFFGSTQNGRQMQKAMLDKI